jgi:hypothetical protein
MLLGSPMCPTHRKTMISVETHSGDLHHKCVANECTIRWNPSCALFYICDGGDWPLVEPSQPETRRIVGFFRTLITPLVD